MAEGTEQVKGEGEQRSSLPPDILPIVPVRNTVLFPGIVLPLTIGRQPSILAAQEAIRAVRPVGVILQTDPTVEAPTSDNLNRFGTVAQILRYVTTEEGAHHAICRGLQRFRVV